MEDQEATSSSSVEAEELRQKLEKTLEALRPHTPTPPPDKLPTGVTPEKWADMKNLTDLLDIITKPADVPKSPTPPPSVK